LFGSILITSKDASIFDKKILNIGKTTPEAKAAIMPIIKLGILSFE
jgi:hypothetical protein